MTDERRNHAWSLGTDGAVASRPASPAELEAARAGAEAVPISRISVRTCWECNPAHASFLASGGMGTDWYFHCAVGCGRWFFDGVDITEYEDGEDGR